MNLKVFLDILFRQHTHQSICRRPLGHCSGGFRTCSGRQHQRLWVPKTSIWTPSARTIWSRKSVAVRSDCSRISGLCVESRGLRAMMEHARGVPIDLATC